MPGTLVFFESPRRIAETLADCAAALGPRHAAIARELTKLYESVRRGTLDELAAQLAQEEPPKGEIVLLVAPPLEGDAAMAEADLDAQNRRSARLLFGQGRRERRLRGDRPAPPAGLRPRAATRRRENKEST